MAGHRKAGPLDRFLCLFTDVRAGEGASVLLLAVNVFLLLTAYYMLKPLREGLLLGERGPEFAAYTAAAMALLLVPLVSGYGRLADRFPRRRLINVVTLIFVLCLVGFFLAGRGGLPTGIAFYIWVGIFNVMIIAQFWAFANDVYTNAEGERLFPIVQVGGAAGAIVGAAVVGRMIEPLGLFVPMLGAAALLLVSLLLTHLVDRRERARTEAVAPGGLSTDLAPAASGEFRLDTGEFKSLRRALREALDRQARGEDPLPPAEGDGPEAGEPPDGAGGTEANGATEGGHPATGAFRLVLSTRYLLLIALLILMLNWVNTNGENLLKFLVSDTARAAVASGAAGTLDVGEYIGAFYADFFFGVNVLALALQLFVVSRVFKYFGVHLAILVLPLIALGSYGLAALFPVLGYVRWTKTAENSTDYSLQNTVRHTLFLPTTREQKYKAKQVIDSFFWRAGDTLAGVTVLVVTGLLGSNIRYFAALNLVLVLGWLYLAYRIGRMYRELVRTGRPPVPVRRGRAA